MATGTIQKNMVLLWENPNPNQAFGSAAFSFSDDYPLYMIVYKRDKDMQVAMSQIFSHGLGAQLISGSGYYNKLYERGYDWVSGGGLQSDGGYAGNSTRTTDCCIPLYVYGIKA